MEQFESNVHNAEPHNLKWDGRGFCYIGYHWETELEWPAILWFTQTANLPVFADGEVAYAIPKRAFPTPAMREELEARIARQVRAVGDSTTRD